MTKQEKIQEAYGKYWEQVKDYVNKNGWCSIRRGVGFDEIISNLPWETRIGNQYCWRPKLLKGLEKNNGWTKIENESDLPTIGEYYTIASFDNSIVEREFPHPKFSLEFNKEWWLKYITHYQQIIKPEKPLY